jgi:hypothetical protein
MALSSESCLLTSRWRKRNVALTADRAEEVIKERLRFAFFVASEGMGETREFDKCVF